MADSLSFNSALAALGAPDASSSVASAFAKGLSSLDTYKQTEKERQQKDTLFGLDTTLKNQQIESNTNKLSLFPLEKEKMGLDLDNSKIDNEVKSGTKDFLISNAKSTAKTSENQAKISDIEALFAPDNARAKLGFTKSQTTLNYAHANELDAQAKERKAKVDSMNNGLKLSTMSLDKLASQASGTSTVGKTVGSMLDNFNDGYSTGWFDQTVSFLDNKVLGNMLPVNENYTRKAQQLSGNIAALVDAAKDAYTVKGTFSDADAKRMQEILPSAYDTNPKVFLGKTKTFLDTTISAYENRIKTYNPEAKGDTPQNLEAWAASIGDLRSQRAKVDNMLQGLDRQSKDKNTTVNLTGAKGVSTAGSGQFATDKYFK